MIKKSDTINRKYIQSYNVQDYQILTDTGWEDISSISKIYFDDESNKNIKIDIGYKYNTMSEVIKSINLLSYGLKEIINE